MENIVNRELVKIIYSSEEYKEKTIESLYLLFYRLVNKFGGQILYKKSTNPGLIGIYSGGIIYCFSTMVIIPGTTPCIVSGLLSKFYNEGFEDIFGDRTDFRISSKDREEIQKMIDDKRREKYITLG